MLSEYIFYSSQIFKIFNFDTFPLPLMDKKVGEFDLDNPSYDLDKPCDHSIRLGSLCANCGADLIRVSNCFAVVHNSDKLLQSEEAAIREQQKKNKKLDEEGKMILILDLDQTVLHTTLCPTDCDFVFEISSSVFYVKLRPYLKNFLEKVSKKYEIHVYTMGTREYAQNICSRIDPDKKFFGDRIVSRSENFNELRKSISRITCISDNVVILDDRADVWDFCKNLILIRPFWYADEEDVNDPKKLIKTVVQNGPVSSIIAKKDSINSREQKNADSNNLVKNDDDNDTNNWPFYSTINASSTLPLPGNTSNVLNNRFLTSDYKLHKNSSTVMPTFGGIQPLNNGSLAGNKESATNMQKNNDSNIEFKTSTNNISIKNAINYSPGGQDAFKNQSNGTLGGSIGSIKNNFQYSPYNANKSRLELSQDKGLLTKPDNYFIEDKKPVLYQQVDVPFKQDYQIIQTIPNKSLTPRMKQALKDVELKRVLKTMKKVHKRYFSKRAVASEALTIKSLSKIKVITKPNFFPLVKFSYATLDSQFPSIAVEDDESARRFRILNVSVKWVFECIYQRKAIPTRNYIISDYRVANSVDDEFDINF